MSRPMLAWMDVLDKIEQSLAQSLERAAEPSAMPRGEEAGPGSLEQLDQRLARWQACLDEVEGNARAADELLGTEQTALAECRQRLAVTRAMLAEWSRQDRGA